MKLAPGINHLEIWVRDVPQTMAFFTPIMEIIGWKKLNERAFATEHIDIYFLPAESSALPALGVRHICLQATTKEQVNQVAAHLASIKADIIRGPVEMPYSKDYYTVDFRDPSGLVYEVAYTPNMLLA